MQTLIRGTTPRLKFHLPFRVACITDGCITFAQSGAEILHKSVSECMKEETALVLALTQEETLAFRKTVYTIVIQLRCKLNDGNVIVSKPMSINLKNALCEEILP